MVPVMWVPDDTSYSVIGVVPWKVDSKMRFLTTQRRTSGFTSDNGPTIENINEESSNMEQESSVEEELIESVNKIKIKNERKGSGKRSEPKTEDDTVLSDIQFIMEAFSAQLMLLDMLDAKNRNKCYPHGSRKLMDRNISVNINRVQQCNNNLKSPSNGTGNLSSNRTSQKSSLSQIQPNNRRLSSTASEVTNSAHSETVEKTAVSGIPRVNKSRATMKPNDGIDRGTNVNNDGCNEMTEVNKGNKANGMYRRGNSQDKNNDFLEHEKEYRKKIKHVKSKVTRGELKAAFRSSPEASESNDTFHSIRLPLTLSIDGESESGNNFDCTLGETHQNDEPNIIDEKADNFVKNNLSNQTDNQSNTERVYKTSNINHPAYRGNNINTSKSANYNEYYNNAKRINDGLCYGDINSNNKIDETRKGLEKSGNLFPASDEHAPATLIVNHEKIDGLSSAKEDKRSDSLMSDKFKFDCGVKFNDMNGYDNIYSRPNLSKTRETDINNSLTGEMYEDYEQIRPLTTNTNSEIQNISSEIRNKYRPFSANPHGLSDSMYNHDSRRKTPDAYPSKPNHTETRYPFNRSINIDTDSDAGFELDSAPYAPQNTSAVDAIKNRYKAMVEESLESKRQMCTEWFGDPHVFEWVCKLLSESDQSDQALKSNIKFLVQELDVTETQINDVIKLLQAEERQKAFDM